VPLPSTWQQAAAFNQPLSLDTSKVTSMDAIVMVRSARALTPNSLESRAFPERAACAAATPHPPASRRAPRPASHVPLPSTWQQAAAFNQPLSLDTSSVTSMSYMFQVRSARALTPNSLESRAFSRACRLCRHRPASRRAPRPASHVPLPSTWQSAAAFNQPLSLDTSKVTSMRNMFEVRSARALTPNSLESPSPCMPLAPPPPHTFPPPGAHLAPHRMCPSLRLGSKRPPSTSR
jgi:hypothetical protein